MSESPKPLAHQDAERKDDDVLAREARTFLLASPTVQLVAELLTKLREADLAWWSPQALREAWPATERMRWLDERPDIRQRITTALTGLAPKAARKKPSDFQAALIDSVVDDGDTSVRAFEEAFSPVEMAVYGPVASFWRAFRDRFPWDDRRPAHRELVAWLMGALLNDKSFIDDMGRAPVMNAWDLRTGIDNRAWHAHMPIEVRAAIDDARLKREKVDPGEPFHAADDLSIALPETIATHVPLRDLRGVLDVAERAMALAVEAPAPTADAATGAASNASSSSSAASNGGAGAAPGAASNGGSGAAPGAGASGSASPSGLTGGGVSGSASPGGLTSGGANASSGSSPSASASASGSASPSGGASAPGNASSSGSGATAGNASSSGSSATVGNGPSSGASGSSSGLFGVPAPASSPRAGAELPSASPTSPVSFSTAGARPGSSPKLSSDSQPPSGGKAEKGAGRAGRREPTTSPPQEEDADAPATARGESLRELAAAAVDHLVGAQGLPTLFDDVEDLQSFVEIDPAEEIEQTNPKLGAPLNGNGPSRR